MTNSRSTDESASALAGDQDNLDRIIDRYRWGLVPSWSKDISIGNRLINARAETITEKPSFRSAFRHRRCLVLADGFYEWAPAAPGTKVKQPYYFTRTDGEPLTFAGLWETWHDPALNSEESSLHTCTIITTSASTDLDDLHERMPVIIENDDIDDWLDCESEGSVMGLLAPAPPATLERRAVAAAVNSVRNHGPELITPLSS